MRMKKLIFLAITLFIVSTSFAQNNKWETITYYYSKGPVSPEYQYNYTINISADGSGQLVFTKASQTNEYSFRVGKNGRKKLNNALNKSKVFTVSSDEMKSSQNMMGGQQRNLTITKWQAPNLDARPETIMVPEQVNETYSAAINNLYGVIEDLVPGSIWCKANPDWK